MDVPQSYSNGGPHFVFSETSVLRIPRLPLDLITCAMEFLPQADLRRAASVSREFSAAAHSVGLEIHRMIFFPTHERDLAIFTDVVDHILHQPARTDLALTIECIFGEESHSSVRFGMPAILQALTRSLPLLTRLDVALPAHLATEFYGAIAYPAPRLRGFCFTLEHTTLPHRSAPLLPFPPTLFGGTAPRLVDVTLHGAAVALIGNAIPVFARVRRLSLYCNHSPRPRQLVLAASFPSVRVLRLNAGARDRHPTTLVDLSGLVLDRLFIIDAETLEHVRSASAVPLAVSTIEHVCNALEYCEPLWPNGKPELNGNIRRGETSQGLVAAFSATGELDAGKDAWTYRIYPGSQCGADVLRQLARFPPLQTQLVSLTLDEDLLPQLVGAPHTLAALRELFIDCTMHAEYVRPAPFGLPARVPLDPVRDASPAFAVPALTTVTAFARTGNAPVASSKLAALGLALGQANVQPREARAELVLARVQLDNPGLTSLHQTYRAVRELASSNGVVPGYCDYRNRTDIARFPFYE